MVVSGFREWAAAVKTQKRQPPDVWYISYRSNVTPKSPDTIRVVRATRLFQTEAEAKQFAQEIIAQGWLAIAGTINPYTPKKAISSRKILDWIAGRLS